MRLSYPTAAIGLGLAALAAAPAEAVPFGPATAGLSYTFAPPVTLGSATGTANFNGAAVIFNGTGSLAGTTTGTGTGSGVLSFSETVGTTVANAIGGFLRFNDTTGGTFVFDTATATTLNYTNTSAATAIALYLLGSMGDANLGLTPTATSLTLTLNSTGGSAFSASGSLSNPPTAVTPPSPLPPPVRVPEPVSMALLGTGLLGLGLLRRRT